MRLNGKNQSDQAERGYFLVIFCRIFYPKIYLKDTETFQGKKSSRKKGYFATILPQYDRFFHCVFWWVLIHNRTLVPKIFKIPGKVRSKNYRGKKINQKWPKNRPFPIGVIDFTIGLFQGDPWRLKNAENDPKTPLKRPNGKMDHTKGKGAIFWSFFVVFFTCKFTWKIPKLFRGKNPTEKKPILRPFYLSTVDFNIVFFSGFWSTLVL